MRLAILRVLNDVLCGADGGDLVFLILLDLSAAFDTNDNEVLFSRLYDEVGISSTAHQWFCSSYLTVRSQHVTVNQSFSEDRPLTCGVPQGSVLGPILFSLCITQRWRIIEKHDACWKLFADDTKLYHAFHPDLHQPYSCSHC